MIGFNLHNSSRAWAAASPTEAESAQHPIGARNFNPFTGAPPKHEQTLGGPMQDDFFDDEDDLDGMEPPSSNHLPSHSLSQGANALRQPPVNAPSQKTYSAGGTSGSGPDPVRTDQGILVGGMNPNGLVSKNKVDPIKVDDETAEGSKDVVTDFNFPDADILDIAKTLGKLTGKNFILDKDVKGRITIISNSPITVSEAWKVFLTSLDINGFALIPSGKYLRIARQRDARDKQLKTYTGDFSPDTDALISRVFPLKYISAEEVARTFRSFMPANSRIIPYEQTNTVIVTDTGSNIAKLAKMLEILDVEGYDAGIEVVPVKYASAAELSKLIDALIPGTAPPPTSGGAPGMPRFGAGSGRFSARRTKEGGIINTIIADERTNTLIVHANTKGADQVRELVAKLDQRLPTSTGGGKVHVVYLQFADSEQIANTLNNFSSQTSIKPTGGGPSSGPGGAPTGTGVNPITNSLFEGSIKISPDKSTNALVITASPTDFVTVKRVINRLDIPRDQVYVEVVIMEVAIQNGFEYSSNIISTPSMMGSITSGDLTSFLQNPLSATGGLIGFPLGNPTTITSGGTSQNISSVLGLIRTIQKNTSTNILATPQIIALDNAEATFESSEKIPVATSTLVQGVGAQQSIQKEPVTLSIKIKPQINKITNYVKLDVTAKLGDISNLNVPSALSTQAFGSVDRTAQTTVVVGDADTIVLGGLIRDKITDQVNKIPLLGDIPLLGWLFKSKQTNIQKSNLLIFMTPHIIKQYEKIRAILDRKLKDRDDFLEATTGGEDPLRGQRDSIIRSLPDVKELAKKQPENTITIDDDRPAAVLSAPVGYDGTKDQPQLNPEDRASGSAGQNPTSTDNPAQPNSDPVQSAAPVQTAPVPQAEVPPSAGTGGQ
jgi:general secretion pathway protein D